MKDQDLDKLFRDKTEELSDVPVPTWDQGATWDRMEAMLESKKKRRVVAWYWAAASLILLLSLGWWLYQPTDYSAPELADKENQLNKTEEKNPQEKQNPPVESIALESDSGSEAAEELPSEGEGIIESLAQKDVAPSDKSLSPQKKLQEAPELNPEPPKVWEDIALLEVNPLQEIEHADSSDGTDQLELREDLPLNLPVAEENPKKPVLNYDNGKIALHLDLGNRNSGNNTAQIKKPKTKKFIRVSLFGLHDRSEELTWLPERKK